MRKIAFFVEGQTERIFLEYFIGEYLSPTNRKLDTYEIRGDNLITITKGINYPDPYYYFFIYDVGNDEKVNSVILEQAKSMFEDKNYYAIIGLRDLHPNPKISYSSIKDSFSELFDSEPYADNIHLVLSVMQIEAWLLGDFNVFSLIDHRLSPEYINRNLSINLENDNIEDYNNPAATLNRIFNLIDKSYSKHSSEVHSICSRIDFCYICFDEAYYKRIMRFHEFLTLFNNVLN